MDFKAKFTALSIGKKVGVVLAAVLVGFTAIGIAAPGPAERTETETKTETISYATKEKKNHNLLTKEGGKILQEGKEGKKEVTYEVTYVGEEETKREKIDEEVKKQPQPRIVEVGTLTRETKKEEKPIQHKTTRRNNPNLRRDKTRVVQEGSNGVKTITYEITYDGEEQIKKEKKSEKVTTRPRTKIIEVGTKDCHSSYTGCVPIASDVDCGGGSGNGPAYQWGTVRVIGSDVYGLDGDNDGLACE